MTVAYFSIFSVGGYCSRAAISSSVSMALAWHRGNTYLTSLPLVSVRHHGRVKLSESRDKFHLECKVHFLSAQLVLRQVHLRTVSESIEAKYWVSWLSFDVNERENELFSLLRLPRNTTVRVIQQGRSPRCDASPREPDCLFKAACTRFRGIFVKLRKPVSLDQFSTLPPPLRQRGTPGHARAQAHSATHCLRKTVLP